MNRNQIVNEAASRPLKIWAWMAVFSILGLFTLFSVGNAIGFGQTRAYAQTIEDSPTWFRQHKHFVVVDSDRDNEHNPGLLHRLGNQHGKEICSLTPSQVSEIDAHYDVSSFNVQVDGNSVTVEKVSGDGLTKNDLAGYLKVSNGEMNCRIISVGNTFFLPLIPQVS